jgi:hypothetical protein
VPMQCTQSQKPLYDITLGSPPLEVWEGWERSFLGCRYGSLGNKAGRTWRKVPLSYGVYISVKLCLRYLDWCRTFTWKFSAQQNQGSPLFITSLSCSDPGSGMCTQGSWTLWHGPHCADQAAWPHCGTLVSLISLSETDHSTSVGGTVEHYREEWSYFEEWAPFELVSLLICIKGIIFLLSKDICRN